MFIIKSSSDDLIYEWKHDQPCKGWPAQHEIRRIKSVDGHLAMLSYAIKTKKIDEALRSEWVKRISAATIKKIELGSLSKKKSSKNMGIPPMRHLQRKVQGLYTSTRIQEPVLATVAELLRLYLLKQVILRNPFRVFLLSIRS